MSQESYATIARHSTLLDVPEEKSSLSTHTTFSPRIAASSAAPQPVAPPPTISTSTGLSITEMELERER